VWPIGFPDKTESPLIVDTHAVLTGSVAFQRFKPVPRRNTEIVKVNGGLELIELAERHRLNVAPVPAPSRNKEFVRLFALEGLNHVLAV
jgi:hypothetical protein